MVAKAPGGLKGAAIDFPKVTVSGTHVALMAATLAKGTTVIANAACEPEIVDVADCLNKMGARISGAGTPRIVVEGVDETSRRAAHRAAGPDRDRHLCDGGGDDRRRRAACRRAARTAAVGARRADPGRRGSSPSTTKASASPATAPASGPVKVSTAPFPGFPTDLQAQLMALMACASGSSQITETIFENRFMHVQELARFGARISLDGETATIDGIAQLRGAPVMATDLRASVSLVIAGLAAEGETMVNRVYHLDRGFERLEEKLSACGASIERISD